MSFKSKLLNISKSLQIYGCKFKVEKTNDLEEWNYLGESMFPFLPPFP